MKKMIGFTVAMVLMLAGGVRNVLASDALTIDKSHAAEGIVQVQYKSPLTKTVKVRIEKDTVIYDYFILNNEVTTFPLQSGAGTYKISVVENVSGSTYRVAKTDTVKVDKLEDRKVFTNSIQLINFNGKMVSIVELNKLIADTKTDREKLDIIYNYIINNFTYDFDKVNMVATNATYIPVIDNVFAARKGVCYDYASLFAAILRANGIPTKLEMGYYTQVDAYHAWNEVFVDGEWMIIDTTYDAQAREYKMNFTMKKDNKEFKVVKQY